MSVVKVYEKNIKILASAILKLVNFIKNDSFLKTNLNKYFNKFYIHYYLSIEYECKQLTIRFEFF